MGRLRRSRPSPVLRDGAARLLRTRLRGIAGLMVRSARSARLEPWAAWHRARPWPILRDARPRKSALADLRTIVSRSRVNPRSVAALLRMRGIEGRAFAGRG